MRFIFIIKFAFLYWLITGCENESSIPGFVSNGEIDQISLLPERVMNYPHDLQGIVDSVLHTKGYSSGLIDSVYYLPHIKDFGGRNIEELDKSFYYIDVHDSTVTSKWQFQISKSKTIILHKQIK